MALFGAPLVADQRKKPGMFDLPGVDPAIMNLPIAPDQSGLPTLPQKSPGFFSRQGAGVDILGGLSDGIIAASGGRPVYAPAMQAQRQRQQELADEQRKAAQGYATWTAQQDYKRQNPDTPDIVERMQALDGVEKGLGATYARNYAANGGGIGAPVTIPGQGTYIKDTGAQPPALRSRADYDALPPGSPYIAPDGSHRVKGGAPSPAGGATFLGQ